MMSDHCIKLFQGRGPMSQRRQFLLMLRALRKDFPAEFPVKVHMKPDRFFRRKSNGYTTHHGWCSLVNEDKPRSKRYFLIHINNEAPWSQQFETILHEWAHALTWTKTSEDKMHGDIFHRIYGKLYRAYIED